MTPPLSLEKAQVEAGNDPPGHEVKVAKTNLNTAIANENEGQEKHSRSLFHRRGAACGVRFLVFRVCDQLLGEISPRLKIIMDTLINISAFWQVATRTV